MHPLRMLFYNLIRGSKQVGQAPVPPQPQNLSTCLSNFPGSPPSSLLGIQPVECIPLTKATSNGPTSPIASETDTSKTASEINYDADCPVCFETMQPNDFIRCSREHKVCINCVSNLIVDVGDCLSKTCTCTGFLYKCPCCRAEGNLRVNHIKALFKGSWPERPINSLDEEEACFQKRLCATKEGSSKRPKLEQSYTSNGFTRVCVNCLASPSCEVVDPAQGEILAALSCSHGHALCMPCSRALVRVCPKTATSSFKASYSCPEPSCKKTAVLNRKHILVVARGRWIGYNGTS
jgi:hypothetical protein